MPENRVTKAAGMPEKFTPFSLWIRCNPALDSRRIRLDVQDLDYILHGFGREKVYLMLIEEKQFCANTTDMQRETHLLLDQCLRHATEQRLALKTLRGNKALQYFGYHLVRFSHTGPEDSDSIWWDDRLIDKETLTQLLSFRINPDSMIEADDSSEILAREEDEFDEKWEHVGDYEPFLRR